MDESLYQEHEKLETIHWWFIGRRAIIRSILLQFLGGYMPSRKILDIGCGAGEMLKLLSEFGEVVGMDSSPYAIELARQKTGCQIEWGHLPELIPFSEESFDVITAFDVIEHINDDLAAFRPIHRILRKPGFFFCAVPALQFLWSIHDELNHHKRRYTRRELTRKLQAADFEVLKVSYFNFCLFLPIWGMRLLGKIFRKTGSDFWVPPRLLNSILADVFSAERLLLKSLSIPVGVSLIAVGFKRG